MLRKLFAWRKREPIFADRERPNEKLKRFLQDLEGVVMLKEPRRLLNGHEELILGLPGDCGFERQISVEYRYISNTGQQVTLGQFLGLEEYEASSLMFEYLTFTICKKLTSDKRTLNVTLDAMDFKVLCNEQEDFERMVDAQFGHLISEWNRSVERV